MPELPEVETVRRDLAASVAGARVTSVAVTGLRSTRRHPSGEAFAAALTGRALAGFGRWGKYLLIDLDPGPSRLVVHLRMSGQLILAPSPSVPLVKHSHVVMSFEDGRQLRFVDPRTFGELFVTGPDLPELAGMGIDALDPALTASALAGLLARRRSRLKPLLLDQRVIAGIGNIYSDEILWASRLRWSRPADSLRPVEVRRLYDAMTLVLAGAVEARGSSLGDNQYVDLSGQGGTFQARHQVYGRLGQPCARCGGAIERAVVAQRSHFWCRRCQR
jgi:formamidopyrimidine-DNA glycosylase